jgi:hypothetical protein
LKSRRTKIFRYWSIGDEAINGMKIFRSKVLMKMLMKEGEKIGDEDMKSRRRKQ